MLSNLISFTVLLTVLLCFAGLSIVDASTAHQVPRVRHQQLTNRLTGRVVGDTPKPLRRRRKSCVKPSSVPVSNSTSAETSPTPTVISSTQSSTSSTKSSTSKTSSTPSPSPTKSNGGSNGGGLGNVLKPLGWPSQTQAGAAPTSTRTSPGDPYLMELSKAYNNANNALYNNVHRGVMTYYGQGLGACGDTYDDNSFTAAVSRKLYDAWPGATSETNRNPICGPYVAGRKSINQAGNFVTSVSGASFVNIGGDGLLNCDPSSQCHIPLTATVKHGGKSIVVKIVDRCEGCAPDDIDLTPAAFAALADMALGRTDVEWYFNKY